MFDLLARFWSSDEFMPHGHCYTWRPGVVWLHAISDSLIALVYLTLPITLGRVRLPTGFDLDEGGTLGMRMVRMFARQLGGQVTFSGGAGTRWGIRFPQRADMEG